MNIRTIVRWYVYSALSICICSITMPIESASQSPVRMIRLDIGAGAQSPIQLTLHEGQMGTAQFRDVEGTYGFVAKSTEDKSKVIVTISQKEDSTFHMIGTISLSAGNRTMLDSKTSPVFKFRAVVFDKK